MEAATPATTPPRLGREGSRWFNQRPTPEEFTTWCEENVPIHEGMEIARYIPGITLISQSEKDKPIVGWDGPKPVRDEIYNEVYIPYPKVETRVLYWNDWLLEQGEDSLGIVRPISPREPNDLLPEGYFMLTVEGEHYVCCTMQAVVFKASTVEEKRITIDKRTGEERLVMTGQLKFAASPASKQVPAKSYGSADDNVLMKAETGAIGRALGMAGMLVVPGAGIASAEDIQEMAAQANAVPSPQQTLPATVSDTRPAAEQMEDLKSRAQTLLAHLAADSEPKKKEFEDWATQRDFDLQTADFALLKTAVKKLEQLTA